MSMDFAQIRYQRDSLANSLMAWRGPDFLWASLPDRLPNAPPSFSCSAICVQALIEAGEPPYRQAAEDSATRIISAMSPEIAGQFTPLRAEVVLTPHTMNNAWATFVALECFPAKADRLEPAIEWLVKAQEDGWWNLVAGTQVKYPIFGAYTIVTLTEFLKCVGDGLAKDKRKVIETAILRGIKLLSERRARVGHQRNILLWHTKLSDTEKVGLGTSAVCAHAIDKAARFFGNGEWSATVRQTMNELARGFHERANLSEFSVHGTPVVLWDTVNQVAPFNYSWSAFSPMMAVPLIRHLGPDPTADHLNIYEMLNFFVSWINTNVGAVSEGPGIHAGPNTPYVTTWSTAGAVIALSRILRNQLIISELERRAPPSDPRLLAPSRPTVSLRAHEGPNTLPPANVNNIWLRRPENDSVVVFVHGVLSDSGKCWQNDTVTPPTYWPKMIMNDSRFAGTGIFLGGYFTAIDSGRYDIAASTHELYAAMRRTEEHETTSVLSNKRIVFVCHSTGGIVARYLLASHYEAFREKEVGLVLIASPSAGSHWANWVQYLTSFYGHAVGQQLQEDSWSLKDLDLQFKELVYNRKIPSLKGIEAYENHFIFHRKWLPNKKVIVTEQSAGRYFGAPICLRQTDHFSAVKPTTRNHPGYELVLDFWQQHYRAGG
jgi:pimeloyl-ACP methyl ester carboxylesterase